MIAFCSAILRFVAAAAPSSAAWADLAAAAVIAFPASHQRADLIPFGAVSAR